jgi:hypothetical protein
MSELVKALIEKQVEQAGNLLQQTAGFVESAGKMDVVRLLSFCQCIFQIVQNQQTLIEDLQKRAGDLEPETAPGIIDEHADWGMGELFDREREVK